MLINFIGSFSTGYVGEVADEIHIARELESLGNEVNRVPRDVWKAKVDGYLPNADWVLPKKADVTIICKWHHFDSEKYITELKQYGPVFYWVWDWMNEFDKDNWNFRMAKEADLYLTGEGGLIGKYRQVGIPAYYFQMDVCDGSLQVFPQDFIHDLVFTGSWVGKGHRQEWLKQINKEIPIKVFSWNYKDWPPEFDVLPAVYGEDYNKLVSQSRVILGFNVESNCYGYWSNRVGKVLKAGGFLLQEYAPGMEIFSEAVEFFSSSKEAVEKARYFISNFIEADKKRAVAYLEVGPYMTSYKKARDLAVLIERYNKNHEGWII